MRSAFDRRVLDERALDIIRACQAKEPCHLAGGAALAGAHLSHRRSRDIDLFVHDAGAHRRLAAELSTVGASLGLEVRVVQDAGTFVRAVLSAPSWALDVDLVHDPASDLEEPPPPIDGIVVESLTDLRAAKLTCLLSRSEPRDLVDLLFLDRAGFPPEADLELALRKDGGIDPAVLAWLLTQFPTSPMPQMIEPLQESELVRFRDELRERLRGRAMPAPG